MSLRKIVVGGLGLGLTVALTVGATLDASARPRGTDRTPSAAARRAGITASGGGYAGWAAEAEGVPAGSTTARTRSATATPLSTSSTVPGIDVASYQGTVNWSSWYSKGKRFAYVKATEGTSYRSPTFSDQYTDSYYAGFIRGSYHFARPDGASGAAQAKYFVAHGGNWSKDGKTLPGVLDLEQNYTGSGGTCWGNTDAQNVSWAKSFLTEYKKLTGRDAVVYTNISFWKTCMGNTTAFRNTNPLWIAYWDSPLPTLPGGWSYYTFWQYSGSGTDLDKFSASLTRLKVLANNG